jgi:hypothetical protein
MAVFVSPSELESLATMSFPDEPPRPSQSWLSRLLERWFARRPVEHE